MADFLLLVAAEGLAAQGANNFGSSDSMSLQTYAAVYWPGMRTTALLVVCVNADIF